MQWKGAESMKITVKPKTSLGKFSVGLNTFFLILSLIYFLLVNVLDVIAKGPKWWSLFEIVAFPFSMLGFLIGVRAVRETDERSGFVFLSILIGLITILYVIFAS